MRDEPQLYRPSLAAITALNMSLMIALIWFTAQPGYAPLLAVILGSAAFIAIDRAPKSWRLDVALAALILLAGISGLIVIAYELLTGNVRLLLWLHARSTLPAVLAVVGLIAIATLSLVILLAWRKVPDIGYVENRRRTHRVRRFQFKLVRRALPGRSNRPAPDCLIAFQEDSCRKCFLAGCRVSGGNVARSASCPYSPVRDRPCLQRIQA